MPMKKRKLLSIVATLTGVALVSCDRNVDDVVNNQDTEIEQESKHSFDVSIPAAGMENVELSQICIGLDPQGCYVVSIEADCDWVTIIDNPNELTENEMPHITVGPNNTGETRSVYIAIESTYSSSVYHADEHRLIQESL